MWLPTASLSQADALAEFDQWVTPSLGDIRDTGKFADEAASLYAVIQAIAAESHASGSTAVESARRAIARALVGATPAQAETDLAAIVTTLYLVTAKSDNAVKCQYPIWYRGRHGNRYPVIRSDRLSNQPVPTVIKSTDVVRMGVRLARIDAAAAAELVEGYVGFLLSDPKDVLQLDALVSAFAALEASLPGSGTHLLAPLVAFQVRGSVAASGGHDPEQIVRHYLKEWGFAPGVHFNLNDITAGALSDWLVDQGDTLGGTRTRQPATGDKTRAFDFVIPNFVTGAGRRVMVQSQFYAGDSGSVSHKNVDQAGVARAHAAGLFPDARFVELVDGAGYCSSLRQDLRHLLFAADTDDFVQLRSVAVRLRRILQQSSLISPLDVAVRVAEGITTYDELEADLADRAPTGFDLPTALAQWVTDDWVANGDGRLSVGATHAAVVERYRQLDAIIAAGGERFQGTGVIVPGFGPDFGTPIDPAWNRETIDELVTEGIVMHTSAPPESRGNPQERAASIFPDDWA